MISKDSMIKKNKVLWPILLTFTLVIVFLISRLQNLNAIPVFGDEAIYLRWSQIIRSVDTLRFIPQTDGKQPLFMWLTIPFFKLIKDPLVAGRLLSILAGFKNMLIIFLTTAIILSFSKKSKNPIKFVLTSIKDNFYPAFLASLLYLLLPFSFFFDRMALPDNTLALCATSSLFFSLLLAKFKRLDLAIILGVVLGFSWLTKSPAIYFVVLSLLTYLIVNLKNLKTFFLPLISAAIAFAIYNILRLGPQFHMIALRNKDYLWPLSEIIKHPFDPLKPHLSDTLAIYGQYISWPILIFSFLALLVFFARKKWNFTLKNTTLILMSWWVLPLLSNCIFAKVFTARYILFTLPPLIILISQSFPILFKKVHFQILALILLSIPNLIFIKNLSFNPFEIKLLNIESGYTKDWTSGWGIKESSIFFKERALEKNVIVGTEGAFGTLPDGLQIYTNQVNQLTVLGLGLNFEDIPEQLIDAKNYGDEVYLLINKSRLKINPVDLLELKLIKSFPKPDQDELLLYQL